MGKGNVEIIVGTNEEFILGYELRTDNKTGQIQLKQTFADHSHMGSVRQVAVSGKFLVSGSTDEALRIFNLNTRTEVGTIMEHTGTITHVSFHKSGYLFSAAEDGNICIYNRGKWQCDKTLLGHKGMVNSVSVHPSGKLALSVGRDSTLRTWNLIKGRKAYITKLKTAGNSVHWSPSGQHYLVVHGSCVDVYEVATTQLLHTADFDNQVSTLVFITDELVAVGGEGRNICLYDITGGTEMLQWEAHSMRVKCLRVLPEATAPPGHVRLASASSDGTIKIWDLDLLSMSSQPKLLCEINTTCRIICMGVYLPPNAPIVDHSLHNNTEDIPSSGGEEEEGEEESDGEVDDDEEAEEEEDEGKVEADEEEEEDEEEDEEEEEDVDEEEVDAEEEEVDAEEEEVDAEEDDEQEAVKHTKLREEENLEEEEEIIVQKQRKHNGITPDSAKSNRKKKSKKRKSNGIESSAGMSNKKRKS